jgi:hypothetical protein
MTMRPVASMVSAPRNCFPMASAVSTATISVPSTATAPFGMTRPYASIVTTTPPVTISETWRGPVCADAAATAAISAATAANTRIFIAGF